MLLKPRPGCLLQNGKQGDSSLDQLMVMRGPLILTEPPVWIRGVSKNPCAFPAGRKHRLPLPTLPGSLPELIKIHAEVSGMAGHSHLCEVYGQFFPAVPLMVIPQLNNS